MTARRAFCAGAAAAALAASTALAEPITVPLDHQAVIEGVTVACTGIGESRNDPKWASYPVRIEFASVNGDYLANVAVALSRAGGGALLEAGCEGPWMLFKLPPGRYKVEGRLMSGRASPQTASFSSPAQGQARVVLHFSDG